MDFIGDFKNSMSTEAEDLVERVFPEKVENLDKLLKNPTFDLINLPKVRECCKQCIKTQKRDGKPTENETSVAINEEIMNSIEVIREEVTSLIQSCSVLRLWVTLLLPQIEDGNNFGVSVQEEAVAEIRSVECEATSFLGEIFTYFASRAKIASRILKHPEVKDYERSLLEMDERQFVNLRMILTQIRNSYSSIHDLVIKNLEKIKKPKSNDFSTLY